MQESIFSVYDYQIDFDKFNEPVYLIPFGDVHRFADNCDIDRWKDFLEWAKNKPRCYFLGMGDYDDLASTSERHALRVARVHDTTERSLDDVAKKRTLDLVKELSFMKGRLIGLIEGNHHWQFSSGITSTQLMCQELGCRYLGTSAFIALFFSYNKGSHILSTDIWAHHGFGGGGKPGGSINSVLRMAETAEADIFLSGHDHKKGAMFVSRLYLSKSGHGVHLKHRKILLGKTGSFQKGYVDGKSNYPVSKCMAPSDLGVIKIELTPKRKTWIENGKQLEEKHLDIHASI